MSMTRFMLCGSLVAGCCMCTCAHGAVRTFRYGFTVENPTQQVVEEGHLWTYAPVEHTAHQECLSLTASHPYEVETDPFGNRILHFTFNRIAPFQHIQVRIEASLEMLDEPRITPGDDLVGLASGPLFDLDEDLFVKLVPAFTAEEPAQRAEQIYQWTSSYIRYDGYQGQDRGASHALRLRTGDCTEYMALMAATCRRHQIPVRGLAGFVTDRSGWFNPGDFHNWTEVMLDGHWWVVDPLKRTFLTSNDSYVTLYRVGTTENAMKGYARFRFQGDGLRVRMDTNRT